MSYIRKDIEFPSSDGVNTIHAEIYAPKEAAVRGVIQVSHGMLDYIGRYENLAEAVTAKGYVLAGNDHLGHGNSVASDEDYGYFARKYGYGYVIRDLNRMNSVLHTEYPNVPVILLGHSMGSFLARLYALRYPESVSAVIIHGTAGPNPVLPFGRAIVGRLKLFRGGRHRSKLVCSLAEGGYNKAFDKSEGDSAWLTRDASQVAGRANDPKSNFIFTLSGYGDLFYMLFKCNSDEWFENYPKDIPTLVISGAYDPVGDFGKGVSYVYSRLRAKGAVVDLKLYEGARHELFNETNREEVFSDLLEWIDNACGEEPR